ncbi:MAG TPA: cell filamentation protein Fic [Firmicutes bacterium]|jgi:Fic family protein|nr:cell filamentation protein Fic [Bacillota bacterium]
MSIDFTAIDDLKVKLNKYRPLPKETVKSWREHFITDFTYNSNAIEGNRLSLIETSIVINEGVTVGGKTLREHLEVVNHKEAYLYIEELVKQNLSLSEKALKDIHYLVLNHDRENAGAYRKVQVLVTGAEFHPVQPISIEESINDLLVQYHNEWQNKHILWRIAMFHAAFESIHPFSDGNGRTGRLILNLELLKNGYLPISIKFDNRIRYYEALSEYDKTKDCEKLLEIMSDGLVKQFTSLIDLCEPSHFT